jgi:LPXTG-motif cell wall-anchored protein
VTSIPEGTKEAEYESAVTTTVEPPARVAEAPAPVIAPPAPEPPPAVAENRVPERLPKTGSNTPLKALVGLLTIAVAAAIRIFSR